MDINGREGSKIWYNKPDLKDYLYGCAVFKRGYPYEYNNDSWNR